MKRFWHVYVATLDRPLAVLFLLCLLVIVSHDIFLAGARELFSGGAELWDLIYELCLAFAASYVFYLVVVHYSRQRDKENLRPFLEKQTDLIVADARSLVQGLMNGASHSHKDEYPTRDEFRAACDTLNVSGQAPLYYGDLNRNATWFEYMDYHRERTKGAIGRIFTLVPFLESDYLDLLTDVDNCGHFFALESLRGIFLNPNSKLSGFADQLYNYVEKVRQLDDYAARNVEKPT